MKKKISGFNYVSLTTFLSVINKEVFHRDREYIVENGVIYEIKKEEKKND